MSVMLYLNPGATASQRQFPPLWYRFQASRVIPCMLKMRARDEAVLTGQHPSLGGGEVLGRVETERDRVRSRADGSPLISGGKGVRSILQHEQMVVARQCA